MKLGLILSIGLAVVLVYLIYYRRASAGGSGQGVEKYGGRQSECEQECFSSQYYDSCMHVCLEGTSADFTGRPDEYELSAVEAPIALDEQNGEDYIQTYAGSERRYETPGK